MKKVVLPILWLLAVTMVSAQTSPSRSADLLMQQARTARAEALASYSHHLLDQPLWQEALRSAEEASRLEPNHPAPYRFLAESFQTVNWFEPAWRAWDNYLRVGGTLDESVTISLIDLGLWLGYNFYAQGNYQQALPYYYRVLELSPSHEQGNVQLGLAYRALGQNEAALPLFETLARDYPDNAEYRRYLSETHDALHYAPAASQAFYRGLELYHQGLLDQAWLNFDQATKLSPDYREAFIWAGRTALELQQPQDAIPYWQMAIELEPDDEAARYFLNLAENQARWGIATITAFEEAYQQYNAQNPAAALAGFQRVISSNPDFAEGWAWLGRLHFEGENYQDALTAFGEANRLEPSNEAYRYFYEESARRLGGSIEVFEDETSAEIVAEASGPQTPNPVDTSTQTASAAAPSEQDGSQTGNQTTISPEPAQTHSIETPSSTETPLLTAQPASEGVLVLLDTHYTFSLSEVRSRNAITFLQPASNLAINLQVPLDFRSGRLYQRIEIIAKPSETPIRLQLCLVPAADLSSPPACGEQVHVSTPDIYTSSQSLSSLSTTFSWNHGIGSLMLIVRHPDGHTLDTSVAEDRGLELSDYFPLQVRVQAVLTPPGSVFSGW